MANNEGATIRGGVSTSITSQVPVDASRISGSLMDDLHSIRKGLSTLDKRVEDFMSRLNSVVGTMGGR